MINRIQALLKRYPSFDQYHWLQSSRDWRFVAGAVVLMFLAGLINYDTRQNQWEAWEANPDIFFSNGQPLVSTTDAGYFLSLARDYDKGSNKNGFNEKRFYPDNSPAYRAKTSQDPVKEELSASDVPMLSVLIAWSGNTFFDGDMLTAANLMLPITALLTALALAGMFWAAGYPAEGAIVGTGFGLSATFLVRTSIGRIDTDQLVVFFLAMVMAFIFLAAREKDLKRQIGFILLSALSALALEWWYSQPLFIVLFPLIAGFAIFTHQQDVKRSAIGTGVFILATNPLVVIPAFWIFFVQVMERVFGITIKPAAPDGPVINLSFPDTFTTITELGRIDIIATLEYMTADKYIGIIGLIGYLVFLAVRPSRGLVFLPFFIIGMFSIYLGRRFAFYGAPFIWFGAAWLFLSAIRYLSRKFVKSDQPKDFKELGGVLFATAGAVIFTAAVSMIDYVPRPSFPSPIVKSFSDMKAVDKGEGGIIATWWDYGYLAHYKSDMATLHDGGTQTTPRTFLVARSMVSPSQPELIQSIKFIAADGSAGIENNASSAEAFVKAITSAEMPDRPLYIMLTRQMGDWFTTMAKLGLYNVTNGQTPSKAILNGYVYSRLSCRFVSSNKFDCKSGLLDINFGTLNGKPIIYQSVETVNGKVTKYQNYENENGLFVLHINRLDDNRLMISMVPRPTWESNFNQLFELGIYDQNRLELVLDNFPETRVYKVLQ